MSQIPSPDNTSSHDFKICNSKMYVFNGSNAAQILLIVSYTLLAIFLLVQMCRLCSKVFSYHKFHIHEAYRFYTVAFFSSVIIVIQKITQLNLNQKIKNPDNQFLQGMANYSQDTTVIDGMRIMTQILGVISISVTNIMYVIIGFTWLNIVWGCDFNQKKENISDTFQSIDRQPISQINEIRSGIQQQKQSLKSKLKWAKFISFYFLYPGLLIFATFGTLDRGHTICKWVLVDLLVSTELGYLLLCYAFFLYMRKRLRDSQTPLYTKILIIYLVIAMTLRIIWFSIISSQGDQGHQSDVFQVIYNIMISVFPILALSWLSEKQLSKDQYAIIKSQRVLLMQSTII